MLGMNSYLVHVIFRNVSFFNFFLRSCALFHNRKFYGMPIKLVLVVSQSIIYSMESYMTFLSFRAL